MDYLKYVVTVVAIATIIFAIMLLGMVLLG